MLTIKSKEFSKFKSYGKCDLLRTRLCEEEIGMVQHKMGYRDYVNEIFAGLMWLG